MALSANERLRDLSLRHQIGLDRYSREVAERIADLLDEVDEDLQRQLLRRLEAVRSGQRRGRYTNARLAELLEQIRAGNAEAYRRIGRRLEGRLLLLTEYEAEAAVSDLEDAIPVKLTYLRPSVEQLVAVVDKLPAVGETFKQAVSAVAASRFAAIAGAIRLGLAEGETVEQMVRRVRGTRANRFADGVLARSRHEARSLVRTAVNHTANSARQLLYERNQDVLKGVQWLSTLDGRTTPVCQARDGEVFPVDSGPRPPAHWQCRSTVTPLVKSWAELGFRGKELSPGQRASITGAVPAKLTYSDWLRRQSRKTVEDILGPNRAALFLDGGLSLDRFVDEAGESYTLAELRGFDRAAFTRAGL